MIMVMMMTGDIVVKATAVLIMANFSRGNVPGAVTAFRSDHPNLLGSSKA